MAGPVGRSYSGTPSNNPLKVPKGLVDAFKYIALKDLPIAGLQHTKPTQPNLALAERPLK